MKKRRSTYWIKQGVVENRPVMRCDGCGFEQAIQLPLPVEHFIDIMGGFEKRHAECRKKKERS